ncbi:hypothetical protein BaRGS_00040159, partial [Batillaria attramentaria]
DQLPLRKAVHTQLRNIDNTRYVPPDQVPPPPTPPYPSRLKTFHRRCLQRILAISQKDKITQKGCPNWCRNPSHVHAVRGKSAWPRHVRWENFQRDHHRTKRPAGQPQLHVRIRYAKTNASATSRLSPLTSHSWRTLRPARKAGDRR